MVSLVNFFFGWSFGLMFIRRLVAREQTRYRVAVPPALINQLFESFCRAEQWLFRALHLSPPIGSSLIAVASRSEK